MAEMGAEVAESPVLAECRESYAAREAARQRWIDSVYAAKAAGESNTAIARAVGVSEGTIRMLLVRQGEARG